MRPLQELYRWKISWVVAVLVLSLSTAGPCSGADLPEIKARGVLRHIGARYAHFVTGSGDGLDVEMVKLFAQSLGVRYEYVESPWEDVLSDLCGKKVQLDGDNVRTIGDAPIRGDVAACGLTILPWREKIIDFSTATFPTQVWLIAPAESPLQPIEPTGSVERDVELVKARLGGCKLLTYSGTCLDPRLYGLAEAGATAIAFDGTMNEMVPAMINGQAEATIQDVSGALLAMDRWPGKIKVIGPVSSAQQMGYAFSKASPQLRSAFNRFFEKCMSDGTYLRIVTQYYPAILQYYPGFFRQH